MIEKITMLTFLTSFILTLQQLNKLLFLISHIFREGSGFQNNKRVLVEHVNGHVGVAFRHELIMVDDLMSPSAKRGKVQLLDSCGKSYGRCGKPILPTSWVNTSFKVKKEIYGFPLHGNQGISLYCIEVTDKKSKRIIQKIQVNVSVLPEKYFHKIVICTTLKANKLLGHLETRYRFVEIMARYLLGSNVFSINVRRFYKGCIVFSFRSIKGCNNEKMDMIKSRLFQGNVISSELIKAVSDITRITHVNMTLSKNCVKFMKVTRDENAKWMTTVIPLLIFLFIIGFPVSIACYVCRGVRKRQNIMIQQQDRKFKEEEARLNERIMEYKLACGLEEYTDSKIRPSKFKKLLSENDKKLFVAKMYDEYVPHIVQEKLQKEKTDINNSRSTSKNRSLFNHVNTWPSKTENALNPIGKILEITPSKLPQNNNKYSPVFSKFQTKPKNVYDELSLTSASTSLTLGSSHLSNMKRARRVERNSVYRRCSHKYHSPIATISADKRSKSVSFFDESRYPTRVSSSVKTQSRSTPRNKKHEGYRQRSTIDNTLNSTSVSCDVDNGHSHHIRCKRDDNSYVSEKHRNRRHGTSDIRDRNSDSNINKNDLGTQQSDTPCRKRKFLDSVITLASSGKELISSSLKDISIKKTAEMAKETFREIINRHQRNNTSQSQSDGILNVEENYRSTTFPKCSYHRQKNSSGTTISSRNYFSSDDIFSDDIFIQPESTSKIDDETFYDESANIYDDGYSFGRQTVGANNLLTDVGNSYQPNLANNSNLSFDDKYYLSNYEKQKNCKQSPGVLYSQCISSRRGMQNSHQNGIRNTPEVVSNKMYSSSQRNKNDLIYPYKVDDNLSIPYQGSKKYFYKNRDKNRRSHTVDKHSMLSNGDGNTFKYRYSSLSLEDIPVFSPPEGKTKLPNTDCLQRKFPCNNFLKKQRFEDSQNNENIRMNIRSNKEIPDNPTNMAPPLPFNTSRSSRFFPPDQNLEAPASNENINYEHSSHIQYNNPTFLMADRLTNTQFPRNLDKVEFSPVKHSNNTHLSDIESNFTASPTFDVFHKQQSSYHHNKLIGYLPTDDGKNIQPLQTETTFSPINVLNNQPLPNNNQYSSPIKQNSIFNKQYFLFNNQHSSISNQDSSTDNQNPLTNNQNPSTNNQDSSINNQHCLINNQHSSINNQGYSTDNQHFSTNNQLTLMDDQHTSMDNQHTSMDNQHKSMDIQNSSRDTKHSSRDNQHSTMDNQHTSNDNQQSTRDKQHSSRDNQQTAVDNQHTTIDNQHSSRDNQHSSRDNPTYHN